MKQTKYILGILFLLVLAAFSYADLEEKKDIRSGYVDAPRFKERKIILVEDDPNIENCIISGNTLTCPITPELKRDSLYDKLSLLDKAEYLLFGVPIKNEVGNVIDETHIKLDEPNIITVDLNNVGKFRIGFSSDVYEVTDLKTGIYNNTQVSGVQVIITSGGGSYGSYYSEILDFNESSDMINFTATWFNPLNTEITVSFRSHNETGGNKTGIFKDLQYYSKLDSFYIKDYSRNNITPVSVTGEGTIDGKYDNAFVCDDVNNGIDLGTQDYGINTNFTVSFWVKKTQGDIGAIIGRGAFAYPFLAAAWSNDIIIFWARADNVNKAIYAVVPNDVWTHIVLYYDGTYQRLYVNNVQVSQFAKTGKATLDDPYGNNKTTICYRDYATDPLYMDGNVDEIMIWNRSLSLDEISRVYNTQITKWSDWTTGYTQSPSPISGISSGRYGQFKASLWRQNLERPYISGMNVGYIEEGFAPAIDYFPTTTLQTGNNTIFSTETVTLNASAIDPEGLASMTLWHDVSGSWISNISVPVTGTSNSTNFTFTVTVDGNYTWNVRTLDNASQEDWGNKNLTFSVFTSCVNSSCTPYLCKNDNACYQEGECTSHSHVDNNSYCAVNGSAQPVLPAGSSCKELDYNHGDNDDHPICIENAIGVGYCYDDLLKDQGEYCTDNVNGCVDDGDLYNESNIKCNLQGTNDWAECLGGELGWSDIEDCPDEGLACSNDDHPDCIDANPVLGHTYCSYYKTQTCDNGCVYEGAETCTGGYYYTGTQCGDAGGATDQEKREACDMLCGATSDLANCATSLNPDCTCNPPTIDDAPEVFLISPNDETIKLTNVTFTYQVIEDTNLASCNLYYKTENVSWHLNQTNTSVILNGDTFTNNFYAIISGTNVTWNVNCLDNASQSGWGGINYTFTIDTTFTAVHQYQWKDSSGKVVAFIDENGNMNISKHVYFGGNGTFYNHGGFLPASPQWIPELNVEYIQIDGTNTDYVELWNPYNDYLEIVDHTYQNNLQIELYERHPHFDTSSGDYIMFDKQIRGSTQFLSGTFVTTGTIGIDTGLPQTQLHVHNSQAGGDSYILSTTDSSGATIADGFSFGYDDAGFSLIRNAETTPIFFQTSGVTMTKFTPNGDVLFYNDANATAFYQNNNKVLDVSDTYLTNDTELINTNTSMETFAINMNISQNKINLRNESDATLGIITIDELNIGDSEKLCLGNSCDVFIMWNNSGGFGMLG